MKLNIFNEIDTLERENLEIYKNMIKLEKRIERKTNELHSIVWQFGEYCLNYLHTSECDIKMLFRWSNDYETITKVLRQLTDQHNKLLNRYQRNKLVIKDLKIDSGMFGNIKWLSRCENA